MLVTLDVTHEHWHAYPIEDVEVVFTRDGEHKQGTVIWGTGGDSACAIPRRERVWRYAYKLGREYIRGIACVAPSAGLGRARINAFLRSESRAE